MYPSPVRHPSLNLSPQNYVPGPPQYSDFASYHHVPGINNELHHGQPAAAWGSPYTPAKEDWHSYGTAAPPSTASPGQFGFSPPDFNPIQPPGSGLLPPAISSSVPQLSPNAQRRTPYEWMRRSIPSTSNNGKETPGPAALQRARSRASLWSSAGLDPALWLHRGCQRDSKLGLSLAQHPVLKEQGSSEVAGAEDGQGGCCPSTLTAGLIWLESHFPQLVPLPAATG